MLNFDNEKIVLPHIFGERFLSHENARYLPLRKTRVREISYGVFRLTVFLAARSG